MGDRLGQTRSPSLEEVVRAAMEFRLSEVHVALPGQVIKYTAATQTADIKPLIKRTVILDDGSEELEAIPVITSVPVMFPRAGGFFISLPIVPGDNVLLVFNERSIDLYSASTGKIDVDPVDLRKHDLSDAVCFPGFFPLTKPITDLIASGMAMGQEKGSQLRFTGSTVEATTGGAPAASDFVAMAAKVDAIIAAIHAVIAAWVPFPNDGGAALQTAWFLAFGTPPSSPPTKSTNLKAD
jgi:hypothetical protein